MNFKKSLLIALLSFGVAHTALAETDQGYLDFSIKSPEQEILDLAIKYREQGDYTSASSLLNELEQQADKDKKVAPKIYALLGTIYREVYKDYEKAVYLYKKAAEKNIEHAKFYLGVMYDLGLGTTQNDQQAIYWYKKVNDDINNKYNRYAHFFLGVKYHLGKEDIKDLSQARYYYEIACSLGEDRACKRYEELQNLSY